MTLRVRLHRADPGGTGAVNPVLAAPGPLLTPAGGHTALVLYAGSRYPATLVG